MCHKYCWERGKGNLRRNGESEIKGISQSKRGVTQLTVHNSPLTWEKCSAKWFRICVWRLHIRICNTLERTHEVIACIFHGIFSITQLNQALARQIIIVRIKRDTSRRSITLDVIAFDFRFHNATHTQVDALWTLISQLCATTGMGKSFAGWAFSSSQLICTLAVRWAIYRFSPYVCECGCQSIWPGVYHNKRIDGFNATAIKLEIEHLHPSFSVFFSPAESTQHMNQDELQSFEHFELLEWQMWCGPFFIRVDFPFISEFSI